MTERSDLKLQGKSGAEGAHYEIDHEKGNAVHGVGGWLCGRKYST
jgi:hypothetical protein